MNALGGTLFMVTNDFIRSAKHLISLHGGTTFVYIQLTEK